MISSSEREKLAKKEAHCVAQLQIQWHDNAYVRCSVLSVVNCDITGGEAVKGSVGREEGVEETGKSSPSPTGSQ